MNDVGHRTPSMGWLKQQPKVTCSSDVEHVGAAIEVRCAAFSVGGQETPARCFLNWLRITMIALEG